MSEFRANTTRPLTTVVSAADHARIVKLLAGTGMTPVRWLALVARERAVSRRSFATKFRALPPRGRDAQNIRLVATAPIALVIQRRGLSVAKWLRAAALEALEAGFVPVDPRPRSALASGGQGHAKITVPVDVAAAFGFRARDMVEVLRRYVQVPTASEPRAVTS